MRLSAPKPCEQMLYLSCRGAPSQAEGLRASQSSCEPKLCVNPPAQWPQGAPRSSVSTSTSTSGLSLPTAQVSHH